MPRRIRGRIARACATGAVFTCLLIPAAAPAAPVERSALEVREALFVASEAAHLFDGTSGLRELLLERTLQEAYAIDPSLSAGDAEAAISALRARASVEAELTGMAENQAAIVLLRAMTAPSVPAGPVGAGLARTARAALVESGHGVAPDASFDPGADDAGTLLVGSFAPSRVLRDSFRLADRNARFSAARDALWAARAGAPIEASAATLLAEAPALQTATFAPLRELVRDDGTLSAGSEVLDARADADTVRIQRVALEAIAAGAAPGDTAEREAARDARARVVQEALSGSSFTAQLIGGDAAKGITTTTGVLAMTARSYEAFAQATTTFGRGASALAMAGSIVASADAFGSLMGVPSAEARLHAAVAALSEQVRAMEEQLHARLDALQSQIGGLAVAVGGVARQLDDLSASLGTMQDDLAAGLRGLEHVQTSIDQLRTDMFAIATADRDNALQRDITTYLGTGRTLTEQEFGAARGAFFTSADTVARDDALQPVGTNADFLPASLGGLRLEQLVEASRRHPQLAGWTAAPLGGPGTDRRIVNPTAWSVASRAFGQLLLENPGRVDATDLGRLATLRADGNQVLALQRAVGAAHLGDTTTGSPVLTSALAEYRQQLSALDTALAAAVTSFLDQPSEYGAVVNPDRGGTSRLLIDLWGGAGQTPDADATLTRIEGITWEEWNQIPAVIKRQLGFAARVGAGNVAAVQAHSEDDGYQGVSIGIWTPAGEGLWVGFITSDARRFGPSWFQSGPLLAETAAALAVKQRRFYGYVRDRLRASSDQGAAARRVTGALRVLEAYTQLGLPQGLMGDQGLLDLLADRGRLLDTDGLADVYDAMSRSASPPERDVRVDLIARQGARADLIADRLEALVALGLDPGTALTRGTIDRLALTELVLRTPVVEDAPPEPESTPSPTPAPESTATPVPVTPAAATVQAEPSTAPAATRVSLRLTAALPKAFAARRGTRLRITASRAATVRVVVRRIVGRRTVAAGTVILKVRAGRTRSAFGRRLRRGRYVATVSAPTATAVQLRFNVR